MKNDNKQFKLNVPSELLAKLKDLSARESRSMTSQVNLMLRRQLEAEGCSEPECTSPLIQTMALHSTSRCGQMVCSHERNRLLELTQGEDDG